MERGGRMEGIWRLVGLLLVVVCLFFIRGCFRWGGESLSKGYSEDVKRSIAITDIDRLFMMMKDRFSFLKEGKIHELNDYIDVHSEKRHYTFVYGVHKEAKIKVKISYSPVFCGDTNSLWCLLFHYPCKPNVIRSIEAHVVLYLHSAKEIEGGSYLSRSKPFVERHTIPIE